MNLWRLVCYLVGHDDMSSVFYGVNKRRAPVRLWWCERCGKSLRQMTLKRGRWTKERIYR